MHNAAFRALGLNYAYVPLKVAPAGLEDALRGLVVLGFTGANVTVPHKSAALPFLDELSQAARVIGAVNTLVIRHDGTMMGENTDAYGFLTDLRGADWLVGSLADRQALVIGAGGAARAVAYGLLQEGAVVAVANRSFDRAVDLCVSLGRACGSADPPLAARLSAHRFPEELAALAPTADLIVNATSLGLHPRGDPLPWDPAVPFQPWQMVYDLVPLARTVGHSPFLALASSGGAQVRDGLGMLLHQGARAFELWTGMKAPVEVMRKALE
jgi:shikimate dehydrogenase